MTYETSRLFFRPLEEKDAESLFKNVYSDEKVNRYLRFDTHKNVEETKKVIKQFLENNQEIYVLIEKATKEKIEFVPLTDIGVLVKKGEGQKEYTYDIKIDNLKLPVKKGEAVGKVIVKDQNTIIAEGDLTVTEDIKPLSFLSLFKKTLQDIVAGKASI